MESVNKILLPRRAKRSVMKKTGKKTIILEKGEIFFEFPDIDESGNPGETGGIGLGHALIKIGDGETEYKDLPYALGNTYDDIIYFENRSETDINTTISNIATKSPLKTLISFIKRSIELLKKKDDEIDTQLANITAQNLIKEVKVVENLPANPDNNTLYLIKS